MKPAAFEYLRPASLGEALTALGQYGEDARIIAGGQSLVPMMNLRLARPELLIDINHFADLKNIEVNGNELVIGALARHSQLLASPLVARHCPLMAEAYPHVAHIPIRNRGTLGGNICHADPASEMPAVLLASDASIEVANTGGSRRVSAADFFIGAMTTALTPDEMVTAIHIPLAPAGQGWAFEEVAQRRGDFALAAVAVTLSLDGGNCQQLRVAIAGVEERPARLSHLEAGLNGKALTEAAVRDAASQVSQALNPTASFHADADYKRDLIETLVQRAVTRAASRAG